MKVNTEVRIGVIAIIIFITSCFTLPLTPFASDKQNAVPSNAIHLSEGKASLDKGDYDNAINQLSMSCEKLHVLCDYAIFLRAKAYEGKGETDKAIADLRTIKEKYKDFPLIKNVRLKEIELSRKSHNPNIEKLLEGFIRDYPSEIPTKYAYALFLKENNEPDKAKKIFKEIFISASPLSKNASSELSPSEITAEDLLKRGDNLNKAWFFGEAERCLREALKTSNHDPELKTQLLDKLAYALFRQKKYKEAADMYKTINSRYWRARSIFRTRDMETFRSELPELLKTADKRIASVLIAYGTTRRRDGDIEGALETFNNTLSRYPSEKEDVLWAKGWTYYLSGDYKNAYRVFSGLHDTYAGSKYLYWKDKCTEKTDTAAMKASLHKKNVPHRDYYGFLTMLKSSNTLPTASSEFMQFKIQNKPSPANGYPLMPFERVDILASIGMRQEAISELIFMSKNNQNRDRIVHIISYLKNLGSYKTAVSLALKFPYNEELHELFYPLAFKSEVDVASRENGIDPLLILAVIREESRFDADARSIAGALGLMQLMPNTAQWVDRHIKIPLRHSGQLYDAKTNILIGSYYLKHLLKTYNSIPIALAAYNAGEDAVRDWLKKNSYNTIDEFIEDIPYSETRNYVKRVLTTYFEYMRSSGDADISAARKYIGSL